LLQPGHSTSLRCLFAPSPRLGCILSVIEILRQLTFPLALESGNVSKMEMKDARIEQGGAVLCRIIGARLTSVDFVLDYLILGFDAVD
jgi:hypothetical protein